MKKYLGWMVGISLFMCAPLISWAESVEIFKAPIAVGAKLLAPFGENRGGYMHEGVDVEVPMWTPIYAIEDGVVTKAAPDSKGVDNGGGHMIFIDHGNGIESRYMHLSLYAVNLGEQVKAGDLIGFSGDSGDATKPLLHYELRVDKLPVDPSFIFESYNIWDLNGEAGNNLSEVIEAPVEEQEVIEPFLIPQT